MPKDDSYWPPIQLVRALAGRGERVIDEYQLLVDQARAMLASETLKEEDITAYSWELEESPASNKPQSIWVAYLDSYVTGAGLTVTLYVSLARNGSELRRMLSRMLSRDEADAATVAQGLNQLDRLRPGASALVPDSVRKRLRALESGEDDAAVFTFLGQTHVNYG
ncbi:hypothetical protein [Sphingobium sp. B11D3D]|uniref:hypothetical protein n=1 Tax=Sphingobium sp. B11D3D TaxID=2940576 RepID=UPI0022253210|nr:hypothetical protein [Sphingobium sp. B11D3D]MCW2370065.1 hypothetical protein [Sphingobium sp. B11D3D]